MITAFLAVSFSSHYIGLRQPIYFIGLRVGILIAGIIYCLLIPDALHFYTLGFVTISVVGIQVITFIPSAMIGLKMRKKIMAMVLSGDGDPGNMKNLPKGIPIGESINIAENSEDQETVEGPAPQEQSESEQKNLAEETESAHENPADDEGKENPPKVVSRYGVPPPAVQKMLEERAASFKRKSKNPLLPKFMRKAMEEKVTYFLEMSKGMREPPEFMARMLGAPALPQNSQTESKPSVPKPPAPAPQKTASLPLNPVVLKEPGQGVSEGIGKPNPPQFIKNMLASNKIQMPGTETAIPLSGEMDDISMAQLKYSENTIGTIRQLMTGYMPTFISIGLDIILRFVLHYNNLPYMTMFGWQCTIVMFLFILITNFAKIKKRGEYLSKNLREIVFKSTKELQEKAGELEKKNLQGQKDLEMAAQVQKTFYPANTNFYGWDIAVDFQPLSSVSGDLYDFYELEGKLRGFGLFDVSGHGISAGLVTMLAKNSIFRAFRSALSLSLSETVLRINDEVIRAKGNIENYLTGILFRVDRDDSSKLELVNAGSPYPVLKHDGKAPIFLKPEQNDVKSQHGMIGIQGLDVAFSTIPFTLHDNDILVLYTDGLTEAENKGGEQYGKERLLNLIAEIPDNASSSAVLEKIKKSFYEFVGTQPLDDDTTIIVVRRTEEVAVIEAEDEDLEELSDIGELEELDDEI